MFTALLKEEKDPPHLVKFSDSLNKMGKRRRAKYRIFLFFKQKMCCHWCSGIMTTRLAEGKQPTNLATFEHLVDDWAHPDGKDNSLDKIVLACYACNNKRNTERQKKALDFYRAKFTSVEEYKKFVRRQPASKLVRTFGPVVD